MKVYWWLQPVDCDFFFTETAVFLKNKQFSEMVKKFPTIYGNLMFCQVPLGTTLIQINPVHMLKPCLIYIHCNNNLPLRQDLP
jgi:hypothetical protein